MKAGNFITNSPDRVWYPSRGGSSSARRAILSTHGIMNVGCSSDYTFAMHSTRFIEMRSYDRSKMNCRTTTPSCGSVIGTHLFYFTIPKPGCSKEIHSDLYCFVWPSGRRRNGLCHL